MGGLCGPRTAVALESRSAARSTSAAAVCLRSPTDIHRAFIVTMVHGRERAPGPSTIARAPGHYEALRTSNSFATANTPVTSRALAPASCLSISCPTSPYNVVRPFFTTM